MRLAKVKRVISSILGELPIKENGGTFKPSAYKRETQGAEVHENIGFVETPQAAELTLTLLSTIDPSEFSELSADSLNIFLDGGSQHMMPNAWVTESIELGNGEYKVTYHCGKSQKIS